jgi:hypothetical protein
MSQRISKLEQFMRSCYADDGVYSPASEYILSLACATVAAILVLKNFSVVSAMSTALIALVIYFALRVDWPPIKRVPYQVFFFGNLLTFLVIGLGVVGFIKPESDLSDFMRPVLAIMSGMYLRIAHHSA